MLLVAAGQIGITHAAACSLPAVDTRAFIYLPLLLPLPPLLLLVRRRDQDW
jgi:hypothetical protein